MIENQSKRRQNDKGGDQKKQKRQVKFLKKQDQNSE